MDKKSENEIVFNVWDDIFRIEKILEE